MKASRQSTLGYTHGSSLSVDGAQAMNLMVTQDTDKVFIQVRRMHGALEKKDFFPGEVCPLYLF